jgi:hypothetical protein
MNKDKDISVFDTGIISQADRTWFDRFAFSAMAESVMGGTKA